MPKFTENKNYLTLKPLNCDELQKILINSKCKYNSANDIHTEYVISYFDTNFFMIDRIDKGQKIKSGYGTFEITGNDIGYLNIKYLKRITSDNIKSPFHIDHPFFKELKDYQIGPFYVADLYDDTFFGARRNITQLLYDGPNNRRLLTVYKDIARQK